MSKILGHVGDRFQCFLSLFSFRVKRWREEALGTSLGTFQKSVERIKEKDPRCLCYPRIISLVIQFPKMAFCISFVLNLWSEGVRYTRKFLKSWSNIGSSRGWYRQNLNIGISHDFQIKLSPEKVHCTLEVFKTSLGSQRNVKYLSDFLN